MKRSTAPIATLLVLGTVLSACGDSRLNPLNWFGRDRAEAVAPKAPNEAVDGRLLVDQISALAVDQAPGGVIIRAVGLPQTQGFWDAELVRIPATDPSLALFEFRVLPPVSPQRQGTEQSREILAGASLSTAELTRIRTISVRGFRNQRTVSR